MGVLAAIPVIGALLDPIGRVATLLAEARAKEASAGNERERIKAEERSRALEFQAGVVARDPYGPIVRLLIVAPFIIYNGKVVLWDKVLGWGVTDPLSTEFAAINSLIIGFYFVSNILNRRT